MLLPGSSVILLLLLLSLTFVRPMIWISAPHAHMKPFTASASRAGEGAAGREVSVEAFWLSCFCERAEACQFFGDFLLGGSSVGAFPFALSFAFAFAAFPFALAFALAACSFPPRISSGLPLAARP